MFKASRALFLVCLAGLIAWRLFDIWAGRNFVAARPRRPKELAFKVDFPSAAPLLGTRPLFAKPAPPNGASSSSASPAAGKSEAVRVLGVITEGEASIALIDLDGRVIRARCGQTVGAWNIRAIEPHSVSLAKGDDIQVLYLDQKSPKK